MRRWHVAELEVYRDGKLIEKIAVNKFWSVSEDGLHFRIHEEDGGSGIGFWPGKIVKSIHIGDGNYQELYCETDKPRFK